MPTRGLAHYNLRARRDVMETLREFYVEVVGLRVGPRPPFGSFGYWLYAGETDVLHLSEQRDDEPRRAGSDLTFDHMAFACTGWPTYEARLEARGIDYVLSSVPLTERRQAFFRDPAGNGIELIFPIDDA
ncbi:MAG: VOC family protein [Burkholderiaceae bacterium]